MTILLGCIADDFTGATDIANTLVARGMRTVQTIGVPATGDPLERADAAVVALKSRTAPVDRAVADSLAALRWLQEQDARQIVFKYCSTFDSTERGNIGPVADAVLDALGEHFALVCPAFPATGRTVFQGHLFVNGALLSESPMRDHPLTPMTDPNLVRFLGRQTTHSVGLIPYEAVRNGPESITAACTSLQETGIRYGVVDAVTDEDLTAIGAAAASYRVVTGASGIAFGLPENFRKTGALGQAVSPALPSVRGRAAVIAGSCSTATRAQVALASQQWPALVIDARRLADGSYRPEDALGWFREQDPGTPVLIYSSAAPDAVAAVQQELGRERAGQIIEQAFGGIARGLVEQGVRRLVVAGGETAGAVVSALGVKALRIGPQIDPGVPWTETIGAPSLALALKSGNFGAEDFFPRSLAMLA